MTAALARRLSAAERRLGTAGNPAAHFSDADLIAGLAWVHEILAAQGRAGAAERLRAGNLDEHNARARLERWGRPVMPPAPGTRWPWQHAEAFRREEESSYHGPRSAQTDQELAAKIELALAVMRRRR